MVGKWAPTLCTHIQALSTAQFEEITQITQPKVYVI